MLDLLAHDGATTEDLLAPPSSAMDAIDILQSYTFSGLPQGLEPQHSAHSPEQVSLGLDNPNNASGSASDAIAAFLSMGQSNQQGVGGIVHSRSMTGLVPAQAADNMQLLASAADALPTSSRALHPQGPHIGSSPGSPKVVISASLAPRRSASSTSNAASDANPSRAAYDLADATPELQQLPPTGAASKATSNVSDLVPTTHYQSGTSASSKLLSLLQQNKDTTGTPTAAVEGHRTRRGAATAPTGTRAAAAADNATPAASGSNRGGAMFLSGAELLGSTAETSPAVPDYLQQLLDTALQQEQQQDRQQFTAQQRKHLRKPSSSNMLDFLYDNLLGLPNAAIAAAGAGATNARSASKPPKPSAMQRFAAAANAAFAAAAAADSNASQQQQEQQQDDPASMDWAGEAVSDGAAAGVDDDMYDGSGAGSGDLRGQDGIKRSSRKRIRTAKAVEAEEEAALLAANGVKRRATSGANRSNGINAARIYTQQHLRQHASYHLPPTQVQRPQQQRSAAGRQRQQQQQQQQQNVLQQLQQAAEDMINSSSYLGSNSNLLGTYGNIYGDMPVEEFLHTDGPTAAAASAAAAAAAAAAGFTSVTPGVGDTEGGGSAAGSMHLQTNAAAAAAAANGDQDYLDDAQTDLLKAAFGALNAGAVAAAGWLPQQQDGAALAAAAAGVRGSRQLRPMSPAEALAALATQSGWGVGNTAAAGSAAAAAAAAAGMYDGIDQETAAGLELAAAAAAAAASFGSSRYGAEPVQGNYPPAKLPPAPPKQQKQPSAAAAAAAAATGGGSSSAKKAPKPKGGRKGGGRSAGRARCSDPETSAALAALTALANAAEGVSRFVGDHAKDQDAAAAAAAAAGDVGPGPGGAWTTVGGGKDAKIVETGALGGEEEGSRAARGPRAASRFIGVTWRERIQRWEVYVWASSSKRSHYIGAFPTSVHAARAYDVAVLWLMGQDARPRTRLNFPLSDYNLEEIQAEASAVAAMRQLGTHMTSAQRGQAAAQAAQAAAKQAAAAVGGAGGFKARAGNGSSSAGEAAAASGGEEGVNQMARSDSGRLNPAAAAAVAGSRPSSRGSRGGNGSTGVPAAVVAEASAAEAEVAAFMAATAVAAAATHDVGNDDQVDYEDHREVTAALRALEAAEGASPGLDTAAAAAGGGEAAAEAGEDVLLPGGSATAAAAEAAGGLMQMHRSSSRQQLILAASLASSPAAAQQQRDRSDQVRSDLSKVRLEQQQQQQQQRSDRSGSPARMSPDSLACGALDLLQHAAELEAMKRELDGAVAAGGSGDCADDATSDDPTTAAAAAATEGLMQ